VCGNSYIVTSDDTTPNNLNIEVKPAEDDGCKSSYTTNSKRLLHHPTRIELDETLRKISYLVGQAITNQEIITMLELDECTFYRYLAKTHGQDRELFRKQDIEAIEFEAHKLKGKLVRTEGWYNKMSDDESLRLGYRLQASLQQQILP